jgi:hypothetical protein
LEETRQCPPSEQSPSEDIKKDKAQRRAQQGWLKTILNFLLLLRTGPEEPREKAIRRPKGKEEPLEPPEAAEEPALRKKAQERKASRKKHGHRKHGAEDTEGPQHQEARGQEAGLPEEADLGPTHRGEQTGVPRVTPVPLPRPEHCSLKHSTEETWTVGTFL